MTADKSFSSANDDLPRTAVGGTNPGDEARPGTPGTGEDVCEVCNGSGKIDGKTCQNCGGTGKVVKGVGGG